MNIQATRPSFRGHLSLGLQIMDLILLMARLAPSLILVLFGVAKAIEHPSAGVVAVQACRLLNPKASALLAAALPGIELALGFLLGRRLHGAIRRDSRCRTLHWVWNCCSFCTQARARQRLRMWRRLTLNKSELEARRQERNSCCPHGNSRYLRPIAIDAVSTEFSWFMFAITAVLTCVATVMRLHYTGTPTINNQRG